MKDWYKSRTIWAGVLAVGSGAIGATLGVTLDPMTGDFSGNVYDVAGKLLPLAGSIGGAIGGIGAIIGRLQATTPIKKKKKVA